MSVRMLCFWLGKKQKYKSIVIQYYDLRKWIKVWSKTSMVQSGSNYK